MELLEQEFVPETKCTKTCIYKIFSLDGTLKCYITMSDVSSVSTSHLNGLLEKTVS